MVWNLANHEATFTLSKKNRATTFLVGPFLGPALAGYLLVASQNHWIVSFGVLTALYGLSTVLIMLFGRETYYSHQHEEDHPSRPDESPVMKRIHSFLGLENNNTHLDKRMTLVSESTTLVKLIFRLPVLLIGISTMINFTWPIGITATVETFLHSPPYLFDEIQAASMRFAGIIGAVSGMFSLSFDSNPPG